jgi:hypothetical protein
VVRVKDQQLVEGLDLDRVEVVWLSREAEGQPQEVLDQRQGVVGVEERLAHALLVGVRSDGRQLGHEADRRQVDLLGVERVEAVLVERRQR